MSDEAIPTRIRLDRPTRRLRLVWSDGREDELSWSFLRAHCPSAGERSAREQAAAQPDPLAVIGKAPSHELVDLRPVGNYAICPVWSDGHSAGIFTWAYLRQLAEDPRSRND